ncbi:MAG: AbrB/MazE/SpoVT family DNA-binding domain-containing protein [Archaeoglobales archaeon]|nr:MAG: AbrB/MazE/SpoVT family DNA-binding domain-containing protein [Archaeoglobales archaeon]
MLETFKCWKIQVRTMSEIVRVGKKHVIVIPAKIRREVGLKEGDLLRVKAEGNSIILERVTSNPFKILADVIGEPYSEKRDEKKAERWLNDASS